jgi:hypothetical protein
MKTLTMTTTNKKNKYQYARGFLFFLGYTNLYPLAFYTGNFSFSLFRVCVCELFSRHHSSLSVLPMCVRVYLGTRLFVFVCFILTHRANTIPQQQSVAVVIVS